MADEINKTLSGIQAAMNLLHEGYQSNGEGILFLSKQLATLTRTIGDMAKIIEGLEGRVNLLEERASRSHNSGK